MDAPLEHDFLLEVVEDDSSSTFALLILFLRYCYTTASGQCHNHNDYAVNKENPNQGS